MIKNIKETIRTKLIHNLYRTVRPEDVLTVKNGIIFLGNSQISQNELNRLKEEVAVLESMDIWKVMQETIRDKAMEVGFKKSQTFDDLKTTKTMLVNLDIINSILQTIKSKQTG